jgi:NAD(P)-dependent dehydrogenase (short-subunit alcohol dehydrogenase family)
MAEDSNRTALVTGANSGLGLETAAQLAEKGYDRVIITSRSDEKAKKAEGELRARTGKDVFETLILDNNKLDTVSAAATELAERGGAIDLLLLNAGIAPTKELAKTAEGIEATFGASLVGHHLLTMRLLENDLLADRAHIVIAGSEAARGDVPTMNPIDIDAFAAASFSGDLNAAVEAQIRMELPAEYKPSDAYATTKLFVAWWAAELAGRLPEGMTVNAVSPGSTPETNAAANAPFYMRYIMMPIFKIVPGMSHSVEDGAGRYLEASQFDPEVSGKFFASKPKKMTGPLVEIEFDNPPVQRAVWDVTTKVAGGFGYPA